MSHAHSHHNPINTLDLDKSFYFAIGLNLLFVIIEAIIGFSYQSLALLSDAGHNLSDVASLALSLLALKLLKKKPTEKYTFGYKKASILASLANAVILISAVGYIILESAQRFYNPQPLPGNIIALVAFVGIFINGISAWLFRKDQKKDLNVKGAYLHLMADALVSLGVVLGGILIYFTHWYWLDPVLSIIIALVIFFSTWHLFTQSLKLSLDGVPDNVNFQKVKQEILKTEGVKNVQHIHIWALSTLENALTAQLEMDPNLDSNSIDEIKEGLKHRLEDFNIQHFTIETHS